MTSQLSEVAGTLSSKNPKLHYSWIWDLDMVRDEKKVLFVLSQDFYTQVISISLELKGGRRRVPQMAPH